MKYTSTLLCCAVVSGCAALAKTENPFVPAQVGIVNHTGKYIYSATVDGSGGGNMPAWGAGVANICCTRIPAVWQPGMKVLVRWNMPEGIRDVIKEKIVDVEKYDEPGSIYMHFFPEDEVRVVVSWVGPGNPRYPIALPVRPAVTGADK